MAKKKSASKKKVRSKDMTAFLRRKIEELKLKVSAADAKSVNYANERGEIFRRYEQAQKEIIRLQGDLTLADESCRALSRQLSKELNEHAVTVTDLRSNYTRLERKLAELEVKP